MRLTRARLSQTLTAVIGGLAGRQLRPGQAAWLAGALALLLLSPAMIPGQVFWLGLPALVVVLAVVRTGGRAGRAVPLLVALLAAGVALRAWQYGAGWSGVLAVTRDAIGRVQAGLSPWNVAYASSIPPGEPFPYGPTELAWYWPFVAAGIDLHWVELAVSCALLATLAVTGRRVGLALAALTPVLWAVASDGSNDTSAGVVLLLALLVAKRGWVPGGVALAAAGGFKFHALAWAPGLIVAGGVPALAAFALATLALWAPALFLVGPGPILDSIRWAEGLHDWAGWSLAGVLQQVTGGTLPSWPFAITRWVGGGVAAAAVVAHGLRPRPAGPSWGAFLAGGLAIFLVVLFAGYWSTHGYLAQVAPILCWELDELAGLREPGRRPPTPGSRG